MNRDGLRCVYCCYELDPHDHVGTGINLSVIPPATTEVETPVGKRHLCARHARTLRWARSFHRYNPKAHAMRLRCQ